MITIFLKGGLGNQLFQIFTLIAYSIENKHPFFLLNDTILGLNSGSTVRYTFWDTFLIHLKKFTMYKNTNEFMVIREKNFQYNKLPVINNVNIILDGYFQSPKYFQEYLPQICKLIHLKELRDEVKQEYNLENLNKAGFFHFRRGDYLKLQHIHPVMDIEYYKRAYQIIKDDIEILYIFCEENDYIDVKTMVDEMTEINVPIKFIDFNIPDWKQLLLMSCIPNRIIPNSTFSFWGAYFGDIFLPGKTIFPKIWFGPSLQHNTIDLCPKHWIKL